MDMYQVIKGSFDTAKIESVLKSDPVNDDLKDVSYSGVDYFSVGEDGMNIRRRSNIRNLGQGLRLAVLGETVLYYYIHALDAGPTRRLPEEDKVPRGPRHLPPACRGHGPPGCHGRHLF